MSAPSGKGALLIDGARYEDAFAWLYQNFPDQQPLPLLQGTPYEPIADAGPILLDAPVGSSIYEAWRSGQSILGGVWLQSDAKASELSFILQRRLRIFTPERRELWLRLGDARPLYRAWQAEAQWPEGFWHKIHAVWLKHESRIVQAWGNEHPDKDSAPANTGLTAQLMLDWPLLEALASQDDTTLDVNA